MKEPAQQLDYASAGPSRSQRRLLAVAGCFGASWLVWLVIGFVTYDPFDDDLAWWLALVTVIFGTPCGAILSLVALAVTGVHLRFRAKRSRS